MKSKKKRKASIKKSFDVGEPEISPMQALQFLEDVRVLYSAKDEATKLISLRVPENILRLLKTRAAAEGKKYQSLMIEMLRTALKARP